MSNPAPFKFTPEMFVSKFLDMMMSFENKKLFADQANEILSTEMSKWTKVYGQSFHPTTLSWISYIAGDVDTHFAYLTPPQLIEVEECKHEPFKPVRANGDTDCIKCGEHLFPTYTVKKDGANG